MTYCTGPGMLSLQACIRSGYYGGYVNIAI